MCVPLQSQKPRCAEISLLADTDRIHSITACVKEGKKKKMDIKRLGGRDGVTHMTNECNNAPQQTQAVVSRHMNN